MFLPFGIVPEVVREVFPGVISARSASADRNHCVESWSPGDAVYFTFITGLTIGYGDLV